MTPHALLSFARSRVAGHVFYQVKPVRLTESRFCKAYQGTLVLIELVPEL